jgi:hypothetical protein
VPLTAPACPPTGITAPDRAPIRYGRLFAAPQTGTSPT